MRVASLRWEAEAAGGTGDPGPACRPGRPSERLIDELWGERAPATAAKTLQTYVSKLRKALGEGVVLTRAGGYVLEADGPSRREPVPGSGRGGPRVACAKATFAGAAGLLREALGLWRGPALADFAYESFAQADWPGWRNRGWLRWRTESTPNSGWGSTPGWSTSSRQRVREHPLRERPAGS